VSWLDIQFDSLPVLICLPVKACPVSKDEHKYAIMLVNKILRVQLMALLIINYFINTAHYLWPNNCSRLCTTLVFAVVKRRQESGVI
jgi:hypothetical protein